MGDPAGIGPEIVVRALAADPVLARAAVLVGDHGVLRRTASQFAPELQFTQVELDAIAPSSEVPIVPTSTLKVVPVGRVDASCGAAAYAAIETATEMALAGTIEAIVTAPINKESLRAAGLEYPGHTEMLQALSGAPRVGMLLANGTLRVVLVSVHLPLRQAIEKITLTEELETIKLAARAGRLFGLDNPRIAVAGLNPHAGENGLFGLEEQLAIAPAVAAAKELGIDASGPWAPDTVYMNARLGRFDLVVAQYHDQGLIPIKLLGIADGVNVTLGLPFVRTSVDHGTAFDIAGRGVADARSLLAAARFARHAITGTPVPSGADETR
jgi:4-hydroxythreonine-4-phosphate dehydrogenase